MESLSKAKDSKRLIKFRLAGCFLCVNLGKHNSFSASPGISSGIKLSTLLLKEVFKSPSTVDREMFWRLLTWFLELDSERENSPKLLTGSNSWKLESFTSTISSFSFFINLFESFSELWEIKVADEPKIILCLKKTVCNLFWLN